MPDNEFDDIGQLLQDVLDEKPVEVAPTESTPEAQKTIEVPIQVPEDDGDILGDFLNQVVEEEKEPETLSPEAPAAAEPEAVIDVESELAAITGQPEESYTACVSEDAPEVLEATEHVFAEPVEKATVPMPTFTTDELIESIDIRNFATLVTLNTQRWHAKVKDRKGAADAADAAGADKDAFEARKKLLAGCDSELRAVHKEIDNARAEHYRLTMPWSSIGVNDIGKRAGGRLMPNTLFLDYTTAMARCKAAMELKLTEFEAKYPSLIAIAKQKLGTAFDPTQYPNPSSIRQHFNLSFDFNPIPVGSDFKGLQQAQVEKLGAALSRKTRVMLENAMQDVWKNLYETVSHAHARLATPGAMFHGSLIDKLRDQAELMKHLNATGDKNIAQVAKLISGDLIKFDPKDIRKDDALRKRLADYAKKVVEFMEGVANASP
ncbi:hypothetical protein LCGC14_1207120 [marine sediment metagenome]|uniref:Uncharacterized protein n=1 Tax=marine sediment metagenome TaxID=412755 RepID=A0A0F9LJJ5_9ZZZZ